MSHTLWIMVEDDDGQGGEGRTYWSVDHYDDEEDAILAAERLAEVVYEQTGYKPERLDD